MLHSMEITTKHYVEELRILMNANANRQYALAMKKYLRNKFEFFGINSPLRKELFRKYVKENGWPEIAAIEMICKELYSQPEREMHYFAMEMIERNIKKLNRSDIKLFEFMIVTNSWWDTVDFIAASALGKFFRNYPDLIDQVTKVWMDSGNIWLQRSCILFQLKYKKSTNTELLFDYIDKLKSSDEFFIKKSIGWSLREYSKHNPEEVILYTDRTILKPLSRKEALRIIEKKKSLKE
jgi:3-methyladenine DNA glycosylase AlkD